MNNKQLAKHLVELKMDDAPGVLSGLGVARQQIRYKAIRTMMDEGMSEQGAIALVNSAQSRLINSRDLQFNLDNLLDIARKFRLEPRFE